MHIKVSNSYQRFSILPHIWTRSERAAPEERAWKEIREMARHNSTVKTKKSPLYCTESIASKPTSALNRNFSVTLHPSQTHAQQNTEHKEIIVFFFFIHFCTFLSRLMAPLSILVPSLTEPLPYAHPTKHFCVFAVIFPPPHRTAIKAVRKWKYESWVSRGQTADNWSLKTDEQIIQMRLIHVAVKFMYNKLFEGRISLEKVWRKQIPSDRYNCWSVRNCTLSRCAGGGFWLKILVSAFVLLNADSVVLPTRPCVRLDASMALGEAGQRNARSN